MKFTNISILYRNTDYVFSPDSSLSRKCQYLPLLKVQVLGKNCWLRTGNRHVSSLYRYIVGLHDKIYLYKDVLISSTHSIKDLHLYWLYLCIVFITGYCIKIELHQSNQTRSTTFRTLLGCKYSSYFIPFCNLQYMYYV